VRPGDRSTRVVENSRRLAEWCAKASKPSAKCKLGREAPRRRGGACSACSPRPGLEINWEIARLINLQAFKRAGICPYRVVVSHLLAGLTVGPEAFRARSRYRIRIDPVAEIRGARKRIRSILYATGLSRDDIEAISISSESTRWQALSGIVMADRALEKALAFFQSQIPMQTRRSPRGRTGALHKQAVARAMALAWRQLTGRLPARKNVKFQGLLLAAIATLFGHPRKKPNLESLIRTAVDRIRQDAASGT
jgi:hypothetical protein